MLEVDTLKLTEMRHVCLCTGIVLWMERGGVGGREGGREGGRNGNVTDDAHTITQYPVCAHTLSQLKMVCQPPTQIFVWLLN